MKEQGPQHSEWPIPANSDNDYLHFAVVRNELVAQEVKTPWHLGCAACGAVMYALKALLAHFHEQHPELEAAARAEKKV